MKKISLYIGCIAVLTGIAMLFSCDNAQIKEVQSDKQYKFPIGVAENFRLVYTDSMKVKAILTSVKNLNFSNQKFPYFEFPDGLKVEFFDNAQQKNRIEAYYGIYYLKTNMIELRDSVKLTTHQGKQLITDQLFWYENTDWVFTERPFVFIDTIQKNVTKGVGMDFDKNFTQLKAHKITGILPIKE